MNTNDTFLEILRQSRTEIKPAIFSKLDDAPPDLNAAYDAQDRLHKLLTHELGNLAGYKIGCTTPVMQEYLKIKHPCAGAVFEKTVYREPAALSFASFIKPGVECEIAVHISEDMPHGETEMPEEAILKYIHACSASIEIVDARMPDFSSLSTPILVADDFFNAGVVLGAPVTEWKSIDLASIVGTLSVNGIKSGEGLGSFILGHPIKALSWLIKHLNERGTSLKAGEFVTLGSVVQTEWISEPQTEVTIEFEGLGRASVQFV
ncbi:MAG: sulfate adenylyltransferase [SAR324 cluster bacterium]|nr:sulfate adenylyltransferase [SAR324 cluster bacterium]